MPTRRLAVSGGGHHHRHHHPHHDVLACDDWKMERVLRFSCWLAIQAEGIHVFFPSGSSPSSCGSSRLSGVGGGKW